MWSNRNLNTKLMLLATDLSTCVFMLDSLTDQPRHLILSVDSSASVPNCRKVVRALCRSHFCSLHPEVISPHMMRFLGGWPPSKKVRHYPCQKQDCLSVISSNSLGQVEAVIFFSYLSTTKNQKKKKKSKKLLQSQEDGEKKHGDFTTLSAFCI